MKKIISALIFVIAVNAGVFGQYEMDKNSEKTFTIQTNPLSYVSDAMMLGGENTFYLANLEGQYKINDIYNVSFAASFLSSNYTNIFYDYDVESDYYPTDGNIFQVIFKPMFVYRPLKTGLKGLYVGAYPSVGWHSTKYKYDQGTDSVLTGHLIVGFGIDTGYKWVFNNGLSIQLGSGIGKKWFIPELPYDQLFSSDFMFLKHFLFSLDTHLIDFKLGYSF
jgi:hypothetical protein